MQTDAVNTHLRSPIHEDS